ncbi:inhibitor of KinA [Marinicella litoralis]|uniref:Inhibitor of KinA n=2 Tax=Marinicella litoralis TaxID=644220 RepID=A0A4R6XMV2_9GAMM|nr:inhibitor of KinA [Marinicella litoralis]
MNNGDCALTINFIATETRLALIHALCAEFLTEPMPEMINVIPATTSLTLVFAKQIKHNNIIYDGVLDRVNAVKIHEKATILHTIPVCYHPDLAPDLPAVLAALSMQVEALIEMHTATTYQVSMLGFLPGFAYLNDNHQALNVMRKATPSLQVDAGSVAIAGNQTGIYSMASPGGWQVIGRTPLELFNWHEPEKPMQLNPLDQVVFESISLNQFLSMKSQA